MFPDVLWCAHGAKNSRIRQESSQDVLCANVISKKTDRCDRCAGEDCFSCLNSSAWRKPIQNEVYTNTLPLKAFQCAPPPLFLFRIPMWTQLHPSDSQLLSFYDNNNNRNIIKITLLLEFKETIYYNNKKMCSLSRMAPFSSIHMTSLVIKYWYYIMLQQFGDKLHSTNVNTVGQLQNI